MWDEGVRVYDISMPVFPGMPVWPGDPAPEFKAVASLEEDGVRVSQITAGAHSGTHLDAPAHFLAGAATIESAPLDVLIGPCRVLGLEQAHGAVGAADLSPHGPFRSGERLLLKTSNARYAGDPKFHEEFVALDESAARLLAEARVGLVGIDYLSVEAFGSQQFPVHQALLGAGVWLLEGLDLQAVPPGGYTLVALPLKLIGVEASPARAVLLSL